LRVQALLKCYFGFVITYEKESRIGLFVYFKAESEQELLPDRNLINDSLLPIVSYNRAAMGDRLVERKTGVCLPAVIARQLISIATGNFESYGVQGPQCPPGPVTL
jgi:hypothetical protein